MADRRRLGAGGPEVSPLCLGGNMLGSRLDERQSHDLLDSFVAVGGSFVDTALVYADWVEGVEKSCSERTLGRWLASRGDPADVVVASKGGHPALDAPGRPRLDRDSLLADARASVENLGRPVDVYYLHRDDPGRAVDDIVESLELLVEQGLVRCYAASNWRPSRLAEAEALAASGAATGFVADQLEWSIATPRQEAVPADLVCMDADALAFHRTAPMTVVPYGSQARGYFDKVGTTPLPENLRRYDTPQNARTAADLSAMAARYGVRPTTLALAALLSAPFPTVPVVGCRTPEQVEASWQAVDLALDEDDAAALEALALRV